MPVDLSDVYRKIQALQDEVKALRAPIDLENSAIENGRMRFIGGTLRVDSGGRVEIVGYLQVEGTTSITGPVTIAGNLTISGNTSVTGQFDVSGPSKFTGTLSIDGATTIKGDTSVTGKFDVSGPSKFTGTLGIAGATTIEGDTTVTGDLDVDGPWTMNGAGDITGDVEVTGDMLVNGGGTIVVGAGNTAVRLDSSWDDPRINLGTVQVSGSPTGSSMTFRMGTDTVYFVDGTLRVPNVPDLPDNVAARYLVIGADGKFYKTTGVGGGGDGAPGPIAGSFMWPFSPSTTDPALGYYGMRLNPVTGVYTMHNGQDFSVAGGSPIPAAGDGKVIAATFDSARGNYVVLDHGNNIQTHYFHMQAPSPLAVDTTVKRGDIIGAVGTTGRSTGNHLHWETHVNGSAVDPRQFMAAQSG